MSHRFGPISSKIGFCGPRGEICGPRGARSAGRNPPRARRKRGEKAPVRKKKKAPGPQTPSWERDMEHDLSRSCYPQSSVDVREEPEYRNLESTSVVACRSAATEQRCRDGFSARAAHPRGFRRADDVHRNGRSGIDAVGNMSSDVLNGSYLRPYPSQMSRVKRELILSPYAPSTLGSIAGS